MIEGHGANAHDREAGPRLRIGNVGELESIGTAVFSDEDGFHAGHIVRESLGHIRCCHNDH
jgi:hypothetical protein